MSQSIDLASESSSQAPSALPSGAQGVAEASSTGFDRHLLRSQLGPAEGLYSALRLRHPETAARSLRVALSCASWGLALGLSDEQRDLIEASALLQEVGLLVAPDELVRKTGALSSREASQLDFHRLQGVDLIRECRAQPALLDVVHYASAWFDGSRSHFDRNGHDLPLGSRMLAIAGAFDQLSESRPGQSGLPREAALRELFVQSGKHFDGELVKLFAVMTEYDQAVLHARVVERWVQSMRSGPAKAVWQSGPTLFDDGARTLFQFTLLDNLRDAVVFLNPQLQVTMWNPGAERMFGTPAGSVLERRFEPALLKLRDEDGRDITADRCPVAASLESGEQFFQRLVVRGRNRRDVTVECHVVPVLDQSGRTLGATLVMHDVSPELSLEARCQRLQDMATKDPLTKVANRAEFNRVQSMIVAAHLEREIPCSLIICDIDHFKKVNDTFGHPAGDDVLQNFARLLKNSCRAGDLVARYGGEEFVLVCADCNQAVAARRAEEIRKRLSQMPQEVLNRQPVTASFGVTEVQPGDTPEIMLARADRALYQAKERGRNVVVQIGTGLKGHEQPEEQASPKDRAQSDGHLLVKQAMVTAVPLTMALEKLRGFVSDQQAEIVTIERTRVRLKFGSRWTFFARRNDDRKTPLMVDVSFAQEDPKLSSVRGGGGATTRIQVEIFPQRKRDRRLESAMHRAKQVHASLRAYLMASDVLPGAGINAASSDGPDRE